MKGGFRAGDVDATGLRIAIVAARFNEEIVCRLVQGAVDALVEHGAAEDDVVVHWVPGAFELPVVCDGVAATGEFDAVVAVGAVIRGETPHFELVAGEAASGIASVALEHAIPVAFGVLTTDTWEQAEARAGGDAGNKGAEAALAAVETASLLNRL
ncbi:MAG: 6,7-dimethyl-8-ribityllumazine synthase [Nitriliruptorales bacterium]